MPVAFHSFGRITGGRQFGDPKARAPWAVLSGSSAVLLAICPAIAVTFGGQAVVAYAIILQLLRHVLNANASFREAAFRIHLIHLGGSVSVIMDLLAQEAIDSNDIGPRPSHQLPGWLEKLAEKCLQKGKCTRDIFELDETDLVSIASLIKGSTARGIVKPDEPGYLDFDAPAATEVAAAPAGAPAAKASAPSSETSWM